VTEDQLFGCRILGQCQGLEVRAPERFKNLIFKMDIECFDVMTVAHHGFRVRLPSPEVDTHPDKRNECLMPSL
jgi:hypothetical protein